MQPYNKETFKDYVMRKLGHPVIQINVSDEQIEDRIDEAISFWNDYHYNGSELVYLKHKLASIDIDRGYITLPDNIIGAPRIFDLSTSISTGTGMWNVTYQYALNNMTDLTSGSLQNYYMSMQHIQFIQEILVGKPLIRYNRISNKLYIDVSKAILRENSYIIIEAYAILDGCEYEKMWADRWLQNYAAVLIKEQWGSNITKFINMQLVGGVQFNGDQILNDARDERRRIEDEAVNSLQPLIHNFIG